MKEGTWVMSPIEVFALNGIYRKLPQIVSTLPSFLALLWSAIRVTCRINCSCVAYANLDIRNGGTGCLQWFDELMDIKEFDGDDNIYIRMDASEIAGHEFNKRKDVFTIVLPIMSATLLLSAMARSCMKRKKMLHMKKQGELE
ncbi:G-type lectin S-receptor-like serine/threonine-protein kinase, partial [Tanacetum coccineum]